MPPPDPFPPVVNALAAVLAVPSANPSYKTGVATSPDPALAASFTGLMNVLYGASADMRTVGGAIATSLASVASVVSALADEIATLGSLSDPNVMTDLQTALTNALHKYAPNVANAVLASGTSLASQIQGLLAASGQTPAKAANELYSLAQQLNLIAQDIRPQ
jgi:hypothetical protein